MNKILILYIFIMMFLSCGSSDKPSKESGPFAANSSKGLNASKKIIAYKLDSMFTKLNKSGAFNGSILVAKSGSILYSNNIGYCDKENNCLLNDSSMFQLASVSKVITATAVLMLFEKDLIDLEKPFSFYFPDFPYQAVTVKQMLNHRSGLPNYIYALNREIGIPNYKMSNDEMYDFIKAKNPPAYLKPNSRFNYCNTNYALLAMLIEKVSGKTFSEFLKEELFLPVGMRHTATINDLDLSEPNVTKPYDQRWKGIDFDASDYVLGDKSIYSTTYDLYLFSEALYQNKIIKPETQELAYAAYSREKRDSNYGLGWRIRDFNSSVKKEVFHNGWWHGYRSSFHRRLSDTLTIIVLSNQLNKAAYQTHLIYNILDSSEARDADGEED
jgi:CubicO group peptidase (beta-lactamase class C family)